MGFGTFQQDGFSINNPFSHGGWQDKVSGVLGWMAVSEDLGRIGLHGETAQEAQTRQLRAKAESSDPTNPTTYLIGDEPDLTTVDLDAVTATTNRNVTDPYEGRFSDNQGNVVNGAGNHYNEKRYGGNLHLDRRHISRQETWIWHQDAYGSWWSNPFTGLHHILFEAPPLVGHGIVSNAMYYLYRTSYMAKKRF